MICQSNSASRLSNLSKLENEITELTSLLGMPHSKFSIGHRKDSLTSQGIDEFFFLFSANKGVKADEISKIAVVVKFQINVEFQIFAG